MKQFALSLNEALRKNETIIFSVNCNIRYSGRAESFLPDGDRLIIIKQDGTMLVHQPKGSSPVNYMKEGSSHSFIQKGSGLFLLSGNISQKEFMDIKINGIHFIQTKELVDGQKIQLAGSERDMADMIYAEPKLIERGFRPLSREEHTKYGFIDVFGHDKDNILVIIECKRYSADLSAVQQLRRYVEKMKKSKGLKRIRGIIAAPKISANAEKMLKDFGFEFKAIKPPKYLERHDKKQKRLGEF
ncbi:MAG: endonuclease NucS [Nanoarchaeota archaeon]|nr:endonuclease NucS [Nanoarchaeota archaeon]